MTVFVENFLPSMVTLLSRQTMIMNDTSILLLDIPDHQHHMSWFRVSRFGNYVVGEENAGTIIKSITIRIFGPMAYGFGSERKRDAYVRLDMTKNGQEIVRGLHASVLTQGKGINFKNRKVMGLGAQGECPICLETEIAGMYPVQKMDCGHGCCTECLIACVANKSKLKCPTCRKPCSMSTSMSDFNDRMFESKFKRNPTFKRCT